ncbi:MAG TPA: hypothetical protein PLB21_09165 [Actinomycetota bacterium]|nr:hypothetical protein [Actinomycetota bacterium]
MSTLMQLSNEVLAANPAVAIPMAEGDGILDLISSKNTQTQTVLRGVAVTLGIIFIIIQAVSSRGSMARVIIAALAAGVFIWGVWNVTAVKDRVGNELSMGAPVVQVDSAGPADPFTALGPV